MYKFNAKKRNLVFDLSKEQFNELTRANCVYCNKAPESRVMDKKLITVNGIDRIDNNHGYIFGNVVSCCKMCNQMKSNLTYIEFKNHINNISSFLKNYV